MEVSTEIPCSVTNLYRELENAVKGAREQVEWRREYMNFQEMLEIEREEGRKEEREKTEREKKRADAAEEEIRRLRKELEAFRKEKGC